MGLKNRTSWGPDETNFITPYRVDFFKISLKVTLFKTEIPLNFTGISFVNFKGISVIKLKPISIKGISYLKLKVISNFGPHNL